MFVGRATFILAMNLSHPRAPAAAQEKSTAAPRTRSTFDFANEYGANPHLDVMHNKRSGLQVIDKIGLEWQGASSRELSEGQFRGNRYGGLWSSL